MMKRLASMILATFLLLVAAPVGLASAQSTAGCATQAAPGAQWYDPIISGLWAGVNLDFGGTYTVNGQKVQTPTIPCPVPTTPQQPIASETAPSQTSTTMYAALGDSVAAGLGLSNTSPVQPSQTSCGRTQSAYPYQVAASLHLGLIHAACSGATVGDLFTTQHTAGQNQPPQLDAAFSHGTPRLITITAGANDAHWVQFMQTCYVTNCATRTQTNLANAYLIALRAKLLVLFPAIQARSHGNPPEVIMTGYYNPISPACSSYTANITPAEVTWMTGEVNALNQTIQNALKPYQFARFAPVDFTGHDICSTDSWVQGLNDPAPFHPTMQGQQVIAQDVLAVYGQQ